MKGYIKNKTNLWAHTMKRAVGPGAQIPLEELYEQYGKKYNLSEGDEFVRWLQDVKLRDRNKWQVYGEDNKPYTFGSTQNKEEIEEDKEVKVVVEGDKTEAVNAKVKSRGDNVAPLVPKEMTIEDITGLSVRKARDIVPHIMDVQILKYSLQQANQLTGKDSLCRVLRKRIQELEVSTRR